jgi:hypothetical protein
VRQYVEIIPTTFLRRPIRGGLAGAKARLKIDGPDRSSDSAMKSQVAISDATTRWLVRGAIPQVLLEPAHTHSQDLAA